MLKKHSVKVLFDGMLKFLASRINTYALYSHGFQKEIKKALLLHLLEYHISHGHHLSSRKLLQEIRKIGAN